MNSGKGEAKEIKKFAHATFVVVYHCTNEPMQREVIHEQDSLELAGMTS